MEQMRQQMRMLKKGKSTGGGGGSRPKPRTSKSNTSASRPRNSGPRRSTGYGDPDYDLHDDDDSGFLPQESTSLVSFDMKRELANKITNCEGQQLEEAINIIRESAPKLLGEDENQEIELDIDLLDDNTLLKLYNYVVRGERSRRDSISMPKLSAAEQVRSVIAVLIDAHRTFRDSRASKRRCRSSSNLLLPRPAPNRPSLSPLSPTVRSSPASLLHTSTRVTKRTTRATKAELESKQSIPVRPILHSRPTLFRMYTSY